MIRTPQPRGRVSRSTGGPSMGQGGAGWGWGWARHRPLWRDQERTIQLLCPPQKKCLINGNTHTHTLKNVRLANVEYRSMLRLLTAILYGNPAATVLPGGGGPTGSISPQERNKRQVTTAFPSAPRGEDTEREDWRGDGSAALLQRRSTWAARFQRVAGTGRYPEVGGFPARWLLPGYGRKRQ